MGVGGEGVWQLIGALRSGAASPDLSIAFGGQPGEGATTGAAVSVRMVGSDPTGMWI